MDIATVSVVSTAAVAGLTIATNVYTGERQRRHETDLDFEKRVWERKSEVLLKVIQECQRLRASDDPVTEDNRVTYALNLSRMLDTLHDTRPTVEAFASSRCRESLTDLIDAFEKSGVKYDVGRRAEHWLDKALKTGLADMESRRRYRDWRQKAEEEAVADFGPDLTDLRARAERLLEAARESVRRAKD